MDAMTMMYETLGPIVTNGKWNAQLTATSSKEDAEKFRKLYDQQQNAARNANSSKTDASKEDAPKAETAENTAEDTGKAVDVQEDPKLREQMMLAAMALMHNPVVTVVQEPVVVEQSAEAQPAVELAVQPEMEIQEAPVVQEQTVQAEVLPEAPQAAEQAVQRTFAQEVEAVETVPQQAEELPEIQSVRTAESGADVQDSEDETPEAGGETAVFQDVREIPVKVGEPEAAEKSAESKPVETQISEKLTEALKNGETRVEIQLSPENLGKVTVEVTLSQDGTLHVALHAESAQTRGLLARDLSGLQMMLARNTQQDVRVEIPRQEDNRNIYDQEKGQEQRNPQQQQHRERREHTDDFLHQLRLGLIPVDGE